MAELRAIDPDEPLPPVYLMRKADKPGPRCASHWRDEVKRKKRETYGRDMLRKYGITYADYERLYAYQGGRCYICQYATGKTVNLCIDHDHNTGAVRGLLCKSCNTMLGRAGDDPTFFTRAWVYLKMPPMERMRNGN